MNLLKQSKYLSYVLRHNPSSANITLDENGWADVNSILLNCKLTMEQLRSIVDSDDKKRYSFNGDSTKIRANQGHSIGVNLALKAVEPPDYLFHGTADRFVDAIFRDGLNRMRRDHVHLSSDIETAAKVGKRHGNPMVLTIEAKEMHKNGYRFYKSENDVWLTNHVPMAYIFVDGSIANFIE